ncbi:hypothetical protein M2152_002591 [Microbacteriaceae bacterium SG_E_30_P1]|uniref:Uncharacterized protein n=1 Tax=Antiquaquibacter oligotrophicus TaxID=2880260 RepID=A0ABT6KT98_9MICO|nr:hypothetical protein [Antiquaquibacter oligotrophicus]MDH6182409.1 hypothetical protein [Antiquaquibacter oligotrophicus]UDF14619.1 hypothetical protein LH407_07090 [Antiquaquibacter oligotrophicus]
MPTDATTPADELKAPVPAAEANLPDFGDEEHPEPPSDDHRPFTDHDFGSTS